MKQNFYIILCFLLLSLTRSYSQESIKIGIKGGLNVANIWGYGTSPNNSPIGGLNAGVYVNVGLAKKMGITAEVLYSQKGTVTKVSPAYQFVRINYIDIPVLFTYEFAKGLTGQIGLGMAIPTQAYIRQGANETSFLPSCSTLVLSIPMGMVYEFDNGINFGWRADFGASNIATHSVDGGKNYVFMLSVGYSFYKKEK